MEKHRTKRRRGSNKAEISAAWDAGESAVSIADRFQVSVTTVYRYNRDKPLRKRKVTTGDIKIIRELRKKGLSGTEIAAVTGIKTGTLYRFIRGIPRGGDAK